MADVEGWSPTELRALEDARIKRQPQEVRELRMALAFARAEVERLERELANMVLKSRGR